MFYSDMDHEIKPIANKKGVRLAITFDVCSVTQSKRHFF